MRRSFYELYIHVIWSTKNREPVITEADEKRIYSLVKEKCRKYDMDLIALGNTNDHIHMLLSFNPNIKISDFVAEVKGVSSHYINKYSKRGLYWQDGYGVISLSKSGQNFVTKYINNQKQHHQEKRTLVALLEKMAN